MMGSEVDDLRKKLEKSEDNLQKLKKLAHKAVTDYEDLQRKYDQNQKQYEEVKSRLAEREETLQRLEELLEPALTEHDELKVKYEIAIGIRDAAEKFATQMHKENDKLKRQSQLLLAKLSSVEISVDDLETISDVGEANQVELEQTEHLKQVIDKLENEVACVKGQVKRYESEIASMRAKEDHMMFLYKREVERSQRYQSTLQEYEKSQQQFELLSEGVLAEYKELKAKYEEERAKTNAAAQYASLMVAENKAAQRQSSALLASVGNDKKLTESLKKIEELSRELEESRYKHKEEVTELKQILETVQSVKTIESLEKSLQQVQDELEETRKQSSEFSIQLRQVQAENEELAKRLKDAELKLCPPPPTPPPLPPPGGFFKPLRQLLNIKSKEKHLTSPTQEVKKPKFTVKTDESMSAAINEMMDRIKRGDALKPIDRKPKPSDSLLRRPSVQEDDKDPQAISEMETILGRMKRSQTTVNSTKQEASGLSSGGEDGDEESELSRAFRKMSRKKGPEQNNNDNSPAAVSSISSVIAPSGGGGSRGQWNLSQIRETEEKD